MRQTNGSVRARKALLIHPIDAAVRQIEGQLCPRVNNRGSFEAPAEISEDIMPGLAMANVRYGRASSQWHIGERD